MFRSSWPRRIALSISIFSLVACATPATRTASPPAAPTQKVAATVPSPTQAASAPASTSASSTRGNDGAVPSAKAGHTAATSGPAQTESSDSNSIEKIVSATLDRMTLRQKIGQHFIMWIPGKDTVGMDASDEIQSVGPAGIILYPWNFSSRSSVQQMVSGYQAVAEASEPGVSLFVCTDQEGGRVATFRFDSFVRFPSQYEMGTYNDPTVMKAAGYLNGVQLRSVGVNMELGPVVDIYPTPDSSIIGDRSLGPNPAVVARLAEAYVEGVRAAGVISVAKHFPGHGSTSVDSHGSLPIVQLTEAELAPHLYPFHYLIDHGVGAIMTAHLLFPKIDPDFPATLSAKFINGILRSDWGFQGVVMTDGLEMRAIAAKYSMETTIEHAFNAGVDILLVYTSDDVVDMTAIVEQLISEGKISEQTIEEGARRVLTLKARFGLLKSRS